MRGKYEAPPQKRRRREPAQQPRNFEQSAPNQPRRAKYRKPTLGEHLLRFLAVVLTRTGEEVKDVMNSTFYFVKYDDTGNGNSHWFLADYREIL